MTRIRTLALATVLLAGCGSPEAQVPLEANSESLALAAHIESEYSDYLRDYLHVYLGYATCSYDFIDESVLNDLADDVLRAMTRRGAALIREEHGTQLADEAVEYAASLAVLTTMELWANEKTAEMSPTYEGDSADCTQSADANRARYEALQRFEIG